MARGESGRIVIEIEPETKKRLYASLALSGSTLKDWFLKKAADYCQNVGQPSLFQDVEFHTNVEDGAPTDPAKKVDGKQRKH
jgi:hypothetical protein